MNPSWRNRATRVVTRWWDRTDGRVDDGVDDPVDVRTRIRGRDPGPVFSAGMQDPHRLHTLLNDVVQLAARRPSAHEVSSVLARVAATYGFHRCELLTWDGAVREDPRCQQWWSSDVDVDVVPGPPGARDVLVSDRRPGSDDRTVGFLRTTPPAATENHPDLANVVAALALLLDQAIALRQIAADRQETVRAHADLTDQRQRTAAVMDRTRRELEQDLHDGAQGDLVALGMRLNLSRTISQSDLPPGVRLPGAEQLLQEAQSLGERLSATASGLVPTHLVEGGLPAALRHELPSEGMGLLDIVLARDLERRRYPTAIEAVVYFICSEAVVNARKHAPGSDIRVEVRSTYRGVELLVTDTGPGFDESRPGAFRALHERAAAAYGTLEVVSSVANGTVVRASIPC
ncbi:MAG: sensor histidine kinase [Janthinobacterium lividum]